MFFNIKKSHLKVHYFKISFFFSICQKDTKLSKRHDFQVDT